MAAPSSKTLQTLSGKWRLNKSSSDDFISILKLQGVNVLIRTAASTASIQQNISQPDADHIQAAQSITAGKIPGTTEEYVLDFEWRTNQDAMFGEVQGRSKWVSSDEGKSLGVGGGKWIADDSDSKLMLAEGKSSDGKWEATHLWGFEEVDGERRHTRRVWVRNSDGEEVRVRMVYDFVGE